MPGDSCEIVSLRNGYIDKTETMAVSTDMWKREKFTGSHYSTRNYGNS